MGMWRYVAWWATVYGTANELDTTEQPQDQLGINYDYLFVEDTCVSSYCCNY